MPRTSDSSLDQHQDGLPTGPNTSASDDVADPHPADEEHPYAARHPGGTNPPKRTTRAVNPHTHDGTPPPRPRNAETT